MPDFSAGAMENTGAIFFREQFLVTPKDGATLEQRKQTAQFIAHEIAHQWFGDLVTMEWWNDIWLNEGFATWMEFRPMQESQPEWQGALEEVRDTQRAMNLDSLRTTRPVRTQVETPDEINQVFDAIAYQKTASIIRMVEGYAGAARYRDGINAYLKKFAFANATGEGFWTTLAAVTKKPVDRVLASFITQSSMPIVKAEARCAGGSTELVAVSAADLGGGAAVDVVGDSGLLQARARRKSGAWRVPPALCEHSGDEARRLLVMDIRERRQPRLLPHVLRCGQPARTRQGRDERPTHTSGADHPSRRSLDAGWPRRSEHRRVSVVVESTGED